MSEKNIESKKDLWENIIQIRGTNYQTKRDRVDINAEEDSVDNPTKVKSLETALNYVPKDNPVRET